MARRWRVFAVLSIAVFLSSVDLFIVNIALPDVRRDFPGTTFGGLSWILNGYAIVFAALLVLGGRLGDVLGRRRVFLAGLWVFLAGSALCALAPSLETLVAARVVQAAGAAALTPNSLGLLLPEFPAHRRSTAVGAWVAVGGVGAALAPPLGGLLAEISWRWVFLVNLPLGLLCAVLSLRLLREHREAREEALPDALGAVVLAGAVGFATLALVEGERWGWDLRVAGALALSAAAWAWVVRRSARHPAPILDLGLLRTPAFALACAAGLVLFACFSGTLVMNVIFFVDAWDYSTATAGLAFAPGPTMAMLTANVAGRIADRVGPAGIGVPGAALLALGCLWWAWRAGPEAAYAADFLPGQLVTGVGVGLTLPAFTAAAAAAAPALRLSTGLGLVTTFRQIGAATGVAVWALIAGTGAIGLATFDRGWLAMAAFATCGGLLLAFLPRAVRRRAAILAAAPVPPNGSAGAAAGVRAAAAVPGRRRG